MTVDELRNLVQLTYCLEDAVVDRIEFIFQTKIRNKGNTKSVSIKEGSETLEGRTIRIQDDPAAAGRALTLCDLDIKVRYRRGDMVETDVNCDSTFMLAIWTVSGRPFGRRIIGYPPPTHATW